MESKSENDLIINLVKLGKSNHLKEIQQGKIRFTRLNSYKKIENKNIGDIDEGLSSIHYTDKDTEYFYSHPLLNNGEPIRVTNSILSFKDYPDNNYFVFCMAYFSITDIVNKTIFDKSVYAEEKWTDVLYFFNPKDILERIAKKIQNETSPWIGAVQYYDYNINQYNLNVFSKSNEYKHQKEYRIAFIPKDENELQKQHIIIDIGNIEKESIIVPKNEFCDGFILKGKQDG